MLSPKERWLWMEEEVKGQQGSMNSKAELEIYQQEHLINKVVASPLRPFGSWKIGPLSSDLSPASISESSKAEADSSVFSNERRAWPHMIEEEEEQFKTPSLFSKENFKARIKSQANLDTMEYYSQNKNQQPSLPKYPTETLKGISRGSHPLVGQRSGSLSL